jgi:PIN domain nuclease of toxin-antitoxin system
MKSVLLDTSFLISLVNGNRPNHKTAAQYYCYLLQNNLPMYLSAIAASEFCVKQDIAELPLKNFRILNFSVKETIVKASKHLTLKVMWR